MADNAVLTGIDLYNISSLVQTQINRLDMDLSQAMVEQTYIISDSIDSLRDSLEHPLRDIAEGIADVVREVYDIEEAILVDVVPKLVETQQKLESLTSSVTQLFNDTQRMMTENTEDIISEIKDSTSETARNIKNGVDEVVLRLTANIDQVKGWIEQSQNIVTEEIKSGVDSVNENIAGNTRLLTTQIEETEKEVLSGILDTEAELKTTIEGSAKDILDAIRLSNENTEKLLTTIQQLLGSMMKVDKQGMIDAALLNLEIQQEVQSQFLAQHGGQ